METAKPVLLEPIMNVEILVPDAFMATLSTLTPNGQSFGMEPAGKNR